MLKVLFKNRRPDRPATLEEYRAERRLRGLDRGREATDPGRGAATGAGLRPPGPGRRRLPHRPQVGLIPADAGFPRYVVPNTDEMEPGTFKDRVLVNVDPHLVIEGIILAGYAVRAEKAYFFIRPSYEMDAQLIEREAEVARQAGFLGKNILGSDFSFEIVVHRSAGRYICGEATAQVNAIMGNRAHPMKDAPHGRRRAVGPAHHRQQRGDPGLRAPHPAPRGGVVQRPGPDPDRGRHQALLRQRQGQPARLLRAAHRHSA